ncbi:DMT family transporter [Alicyclobacillus vulcanalis]|uniref:Permease of the drug/metabolite transporter (DMT) superfamily n=1 Tax=Alicyclobacillus vulcanalis TaxID=252246 RepID=A0A1N7M2T6_9BACL|nr:DMT family transporter [Alicyclobacillus vulcanalis]SIS80363.1 Permease of the drug/metabolite transporter (DMT) superfamily [Alicyclobacillus vulcanalis]
MRTGTFALLAVGLVAISFSAIFIAWSTAPAGVIGMYRLWMAAILLVPIAWRERPRLAVLRRTSGVWAAGGALLGLHFLFWIESLKLTSVASSLIILALEPVFVWLGERIWRRAPASWVDLVSMAVAVAGAALASAASAGLSRTGALGDVMSLLGTLAVSGYVLVGARARADVPAWTYNVLVFAVGGGFLAAANACLHAPFAGYSARNWGLFLALALVSTVLGHGIFNALLHRVPPTAIAMTVVGEPVVGSLLAALLLHQPIAPLEAVGGAVCLTGVGVYLWRSARQREHE